MARLNALHPFKALKPFMPKSLYARTLLILVVPLLVVMLGTVYFFIDHHLDTMTHRLADNIANEISSVAELYRTKAMDRKQAIRFAKDHYDTKLVFEDSYEYKRGEKTPMRAIGEWFLEESLSDTLKAPFYVKLSKTTINVDVLLDNEVMHFETPRKRLLSKSTPVYLLWVILLPIFMFIVAALFMKNQVRPIRRLVSSADKLGKGLSVPPIKPEGAIEVRQAAVAFNRMQERIMRQITQRTEMLAGVSHDLRTPLTRMELELAMLDNSPEVEGLKEDVAEMRGMVESFLAFARGDAPEPAVMTNIYDLMESVANQYGDKVDLPKRRSFRRPLKVQRMRRCFQNLLENAHKYADKIHVSIKPVDEACEIIIEDDGPGIPESQRQDVFKPFFRVDPSRNLNQGGTGLGLCIAQDAIHQHGGTIELADSSMGGLKVILRIPS